MTRKELQNVEKILEILQTLAENDMVAVPIEPTEEMVLAAATKFKIAPHVIRKIYEEMILQADEVYVKKEPYHS